MRRSVVCAGLLAAALAAAALWIEQPAPRSTIEAATRRPAQPPALALRASEVAAWQAVGLARPLFAPSRRPPPESRTAATAAKAAGPPRLTAVLVGPFGNSAMFIPDNSAKAIVAQEGSQVGPYRVRRITPDAVLVRAPDGDHILRPHIGSETGSGPAATGPRVRSTAPPRMALGR